MNVRFAMIAVVAAPLVLVACSSSPGQSPPAATSDGFAPSASAAASTTGTPPPSTRSPSPNPADGGTQINETGQVTVSATWAGSPAGALFELVLDTHSVDLDTLDLADAVLRNDRGEVMTARPWSAPPGGHHRSGSLSFEGDPIPFLASARWIELVLYDVGDAPERTLRWEIPR